MSEEFVPVPPAGFDIAGSFNGVTTAVGQGGVPRIRYQVLKAGVGDEVTLGSLHTRLAFALLMAGKEPEIGLIERLAETKPNGLVLGRYRNNDSGATRYGAMALVKGAPGLIEILVTECDSEALSREVITAAMAVYA